LKRTPKFLRSRNNSKESTFLFFNPVKSLTGQVCQSSFLFFPDLQNKSRRHSISSNIFGVCLALYELFLTPSS